MTARFGWCLTGQHTSCPQRGPWGLEGEPAWITCACDCHEGAS